MNATAERANDRTLLTGPVVEVAASLPFQIQVNAEQPWVTEPLAPELYGPLANFLAVNIIKFVSRNGTTEQRERLLEMMAGGHLIKGGLRDLPRSTPGTKRFDRWKMPDETTLTFDEGRRELRLTKFAEDHFAVIVEYERFEVWIVRLHDDRDDE